MALEDRTTVIYGPPGTGKTTTLLDLMDLALSRGVAPGAIAFSTFTRAARAEAKRRAMRKFSLEEDDLPWFRTLHSTGLYLLGHDRDRIVTSSWWRRFCERYGYQLSLEMTDPDSDELGRPPAQTPDDRLRAAYEWGRHRMLSQAETLARAPVAVPVPDYEAYVERYEGFKLDHGLVDFHDMLRDSLDVEGPPVSVAFIDEAQDLTPLQIRVAEHWFGACDEVLVGGDDDQCIFSWSGAEPGWLISLQSRAHDHEILRQSYRVPALAHQMAQRIISRNSERVHKDYKPGKKRGVIQSGSRREALAEIRQTLTDSRNSVFVLVRNRAFIRRWADDLVEAAIPFRVEGRGEGGPLAKPKLCKCAMAAQRLREGGDVSATELRSLLDFIPAVGSSLIPRGTKKRAKENKAPVSADELRMHWGCEALVRQLDQGGPCSLLIKGVTAAWRDYLQELMDAGHDLVKVQKRPPVRVTTIHGSKGREANLVVIVPDMAKASWAEFLANEEAENRVAYVAVTRTKWALFLVHPERPMAYPYADFMRGKGGAKGGELWDA